MTGLTPKDWGDILLILNDAIDDDTDDLVTKVAEELRQANKEEYEKSAKLIRVGVWVKKINDLIKQVISSKKAIVNRRLGASVTDAYCSVLKPKLKRLVCGGEEIYRSKIPVREIKIYRLKEEQAKFLFEKIKKNPPQIRRREALYFRISWDAWSEAHLSVTKEKIEWRCPHWSVWEKGEVQRTLEEA